MIKNERRNKKMVEQAKNDYDTAKFNFNGKKYNYAAFLCQQAVEKALKSLLLEKTGNIKKIHDLVELGKEVELSETLLGDVKQLTLAYIHSRYPDVEPALITKKRFHIF